MKLDELTRKLNSVGKGAFVSHFSLFKAYADGKISRQKCIDALLADGLSNEAGAAIRAGSAILIFRAKMEYQAAEVVLNSTRVPFTVVQAARTILSTR